VKLAIVGGGPAGLATAIAARLEGLEAIVFEQAHSPVDKACGEGLMPAGLRALASLGVSDVPGHDFTGIRYVDPFEGDTLLADGDFPDGVGRGVRRLVLHQSLARRAEELGVDIRWGTPVRGLHPDGVETESGSVEADWVIGADGLHSQVRRWAGIPCTFPGTPRFGIRQHFALAPWSDRVEVHWAPGCEAYVTPVGPQEVGIALLWSGERARFEDLLPRFPHLEDRLTGQRTTSTPRGAGPFRLVVDRVLTDRVALVGDASGYFDAITGEGLSLAFRQAQALAHALAQGTPQAYAAAHRRIQRPYEIMTRTVLWATRTPWLRRRILRALAREPGVFSDLLGAVEGQRTPLQLVRFRGIRFLLRVVLGAS
jgi:flavin-dependent dehydrogenase